MNAPSACRLPLRTTRSPPVLADTLVDFFGNPVTRRVLAFEGSLFEAYLVNDVYKPRMHKYGGGVFGSEHLG